MRPCRGPRLGQHRRRDDLHVKQLVRLVGWQLDERHVVRDAGVVDEHGELFACAHVGDRLDTGIGAEVGDQGRTSTLGSAATSSSSRSRRRPTTTRSYPSAPSRRAKARPMPEDAPVTSASSLTIVVLGSVRPTDGRYAAAACDATRSVSSSSQRAAEARGRQLHRLVGRQRAPLMI